VILPFFGGYLVDRFGVRVCLLLFSSLIAIGQVIFAIGLSAKSWPIIFLGRLIFGFGGESFTVANSALLADWFKGKELALAFGINLSISKLGSVVNNILSPALSNSLSIVFALWFGAILCGFGVVCVLLTFPIDRHLDKLITENKQVKLLSPILNEDDNDNQENSLKSSGPVAQPEETASLRDVFKLKHIFWVLVVSCVVVYGCVLPFNNISSSLLLERDYFRETPSSCQLTDSKQCQSGDNEPLNCPSSKWYQPPLPLNYSTYNPLTADDIDCTDDEWSDGCTSEYCSRLTDAETQASFVMSIPYIISAALSPPVGYLVDLYGFRAVIACVAPMILVIVHLFLALSDVSAIGPLVGQGLAYTGFVSVLWPAVPLVVEERVTGLAFGIVTSMQNLACAIIPLIIAAIYSDSNDKYVPNVEFLFVFLAALGFLVGIYLNIYDMRHGHVLNSPYSNDSEVDYAAASTEEANPMISGEKGKDEDDEGIHRANRNSRLSSSLRQRSMSGRGGSFTSYEEIMRGGAYGAR
jgi:MFS family permease